MKKLLALATLFSFLSALALPGAAYAQASKAAAPSAIPDVSKLTISKYARERGFIKCAGALEMAERNLLKDSEYTFRAYIPSKTGANAEIGHFTAIVDARKIDRSNASTPLRATLNLSVAVSQRSATAPTECTTMYEQTMYHNATCNAVVAVMAPNGRPSTSPSVGAVLVEVSPTLSLTLIPVGTAQCITIIKEAAFDVPLVPTAGAAAGKR